MKRLPVLNRSKRLTGIVSLAGMAVMAGNRPVATVTDGISSPGGPHSQSG